MFDYHVFFALLVIIAAVISVPAAILSAKQTQEAKPLRHDLYGDTAWAEPREL